LEIGRVRKMDVGMTDERQMGRVTVEQRKRLQR